MHIEFARAKLKVYLDVLMVIKGGTRLNPEIAHRASTIRSRSRSV